MGKLLSFVVTTLGIVLLVLGVLLALHALTYSNFDVSYGFLQLKTKAIQTGWYLPAYYSHVLVSALILLIGFFQVSAVGRKWIKPHRYFGYFYVMGILFFAAPGGFVMSMFINRGSWVLASFVLQGLCWFFFTAIAFDRIRKRNIEAHREWMLRSFALTCAAITLRVYIFIFSFKTNLTVPTAYATLAWLSWVPNLLAMEIYIRSQRGLASSLLKR